MELVVYDETEYFRDWDHPLFNYPYMPRKTKLQSFKIYVPTPDELSTVGDYDFHV